MKVVASINARMGSTRLPGKVLEDIHGVPLLSRLLKRVRRARVDEVFLATTLEDRDDPLVSWAVENDLPYWRGSTDDVLERLVEGHNAFGSDIVVRVCGDTPLIDPAMINLGVEAVKGLWDIAMAPQDRSYPEGVSAHVCHYTDLERAHETLTDPVLREHVTLFLYEAPGQYNVYHLPGKRGWKLSQRLQVDYHEDLQVVREIYKRLGPSDDFGVGEIVQLLKAEPWIQEINRHCLEKPVRKPSTTTETP